MKGVYLKDKSLKYGAALSYKRAAQTLLPYSNTPLTGSNNEEEKQSMPQHIVIIGAVALGPKAACRFKRLEPESRVTMIDQTKMISYGGCGIPYFLSGDISDPGQLQATSFNMLRDEDFFEKAKYVRVMTGTRAIAIDPGKRNVLVHHLEDRKDETIPYDKLVIATGSLPNRLSVPGADLNGVFTVSNMQDAIGIRERISGGKVEKAVVVGAGAIGLEVAEALSDLWGIETTVVEIRDQLLPGIVSPIMAGMAQHHMEENGVSFRLSEQVREISGQERVSGVTTDKRSMEAELVIVAAGVRPNSGLAAAAGLEISPRGAIVVNERMQTSDPLMYSGGDCVEVRNLVTGRPAYYPLGSMANRQGRVIGTNLAGGDARFEGAVGSFIIKLFDISVASAGLSRESAQLEGFDALSGFAAQLDHAHFYPEKDIMYLEMTAEKKSGRVLGIQGLGNRGEGVMARISAVATTLKHRPTVADISNMEIPYSPPFSSAMDVLNALGNTMENILAGKNRVMDADQFAEWWQNRDDGKTFFLDCRGWGNAEPFVKKYPGQWKSIPQDELRDRLDEVPKNKHVVLICNTGVRSYEAQVFLDHAGIRDTYNLQGGMAALKKWGLELL
jgi:NADPH-dependent 2,4-dienoyl-CoA reductase/sulfur reductase-like enzyme/rhodanese-related sulfurtransferase